LTTEEETVYVAHIRTGDFNDVFSTGDYVRGNYYQIEQQVLAYFTQEGREKAQDIGGAGSIVYACYFPVTDEDGNEVSEDDPRYEELNDTQELRIEYYVDAELMEPEDAPKDVEIVDLSGFMRKEARN